MQRLIKFEFVTLWRSLGRLVITSPTVQIDFRDQLMKITPILRIYPYICAIQFSLLSLAKQIHIFRIWEQLVKAIKLYSEDQERVQFLDTEYHIVTGPLMLILNHSFLSLLISVFHLLSVLLSELSSLEWLLSHCLAHSLINSFFIAY